MTSEICGTTPRGVDVAPEDLAVQTERDHPLLDPRAPRVVDADHRAADLHREVHHLDDLLAEDLAQRAAEDGEVLGEHADLAAVDRPVPGDDAVAVGALLLQAEVAGAVARELSSSTKDPSSSRASTRSRAVLRPCACCFSTARAEPACRAASSRRRRSSSLPAVVWMSGVDVGRLVERGAVLRRLRDRLGHASKTSRGADTERVTPSIGPSSGASPNGSSNGSPTPGRTSTGRRCGKLPWRAPSRDLQALDGART